MQRLLDQFNSRNPTVQADALREARALPPDELMCLIALERDIHRTRRSQSTLVAITAYIVLSVLILWLLPKEYRRLHGFAPALMSITLLVSIFMYQSKYDRARKNLVVLLQEVEAVRFIPHLFRASEISSEPKLRETLKRLLPQVRADHAPLWSKTDKATFLLPLKDAAKDPQLAIACLRALEQIGERSAIPAVKKLMEQSFLNNWKTLWNAAKECLLHLESNSGKFQQAETLLRSSDIAHVQPDILLRPAAPDADDSAGEQLLRPGISSDAP